MLRITEIDRFEAVTLRLEGRLTGQFVEELDKSCQTLLQRGRRAQIELDELLFIDPAGVALLRRLIAQGIELLRLPPFVAARLEEEGS